MIPRIIMIILLATFILGGCSTEQRVQRIHAKYPQWDEATVQGVANRTVDIGITREMVREALGRPVSNNLEGTEEKWGYALYIQHGYSASQRFVYFVYFKEGIVVRTAGDSNQLPHW
jgi:outer membrane protein assembly factor BamE (lipoprotein component of BamABCDE complex)